MLLGSLSLSSLLLIFVNFVLLYFRRPCFQLHLFLVISIFASHKDSMCVREERERTSIYSEEKWRTKDPSGRRFTTKPLLQLQTLEHLNLGKAQN